MSLIEGSLAKFDVKVGEKIQVGVKLFSRDTYVTVEAPQLPEAIDQARADVAKALPMPDVPAKEIDSRASPVTEIPGLKVVLPERMGVVKAWDFEGTRVHVEFAFLNDTDRVVAVRSVLIALASNPAEFKQFVDVTPDARVPSVTYRLPVVVAPRSGTWLCAELETLVDVKLGSRDHDCVLIVGVNDVYVTTKFAARGNHVVAEVLEHVQKTATELKGAVAYGLAVTPVP